MYNYMLDHMISIIHTQINYIDEENPITFMIHAFKSVEEKYTFLEK